MSRPFHDTDSRVECGRMTASEYEEIQAQRAEQTARWSDTALEERLGHFDMWYAPLTPAELRDRQIDADHAIAQQDARRERA